MSSASPVLSSPNSVTTRRESRLDLAQLPLAEAVHRVPESTVIHRGPVQPHPPRDCDQDMR